MKAIETSYHGWRFRSRTEARWAVFLDALGVRWQYEPEGFELADGTRYLPDFLLPDLGWLLEVKGYAGDPSIAKAERFAAALTEDDNNQPVATRYGLVIGIPGDHTINLLWPGWDNDYDFCQCTSGLHIGIEYERRGARITCPCPGQEHGGRGHALPISYDRAITAARSARFERLAG